MDVLPTHISHYEIRRVLGQGGMGVVYLAFDPGLQRQAAVKVLRTNSEDQRERFRREARIVARLQHPNIVQIYGVGEHESQPYIAMEYIPGEPLSEAIRRRAPWGLQRKLLMGADLCAGLAFAHRAGVIHRDVKPSNLIVSNGPGTIRLLDFGIARGIDAGATMGLTMQGNIVGTLNYMSPEQITGKAIDHRSDIFAVGLVLYELITYRKAFPGDNLATLTYRIVHGTPEPIRSLQPDADEELCTVVERAMARMPDDRYPNLETLRTDLLRIASRLTPSAASSLAPDESGEQPVPTPAIWSHALEATAESDAPHTPGPRTPGVATPGPVTPAPTALLPGIETSAPQAWRFWPLAVAIGGITLGGATTLWLTSDRDPNPRQGFERPSRPLYEETRVAGGLEPSPGSRPPLESPVTKSTAPSAVEPVNPGVAAEAPATAAATPRPRPEPPPRPAPVESSKASPPAAIASSGSGDPRAGRDVPTSREPVAPTTNVPASSPEAPSPTIAAESRSVPPPPSAPSDEEQVQGVLTRWARAYSEMDARGVDEVQPGSAAALTKAFSNLRSVNVVLSGCRIQVQESHATAACTEQIKTEGVVAGGSLNTSRGRQFVLQKGDGRWRITSARIGS